MDLSGGDCDYPKVSSILGGWIIEVLIGVKFYIDFLLCEIEFYK
jgi:hypothetical protein